MKANIRLLSLWALAIVLASAYVGPDASAQSTAKSPEELQQLVMPIALYPDALIAHILPASTVAVDVIEAARYLREHGGKVEESPDVPWLPSVRALLRFPEVLYMMDKEISWTFDLGCVVVAQKAGVMDAIQHVRKLAQELGALQSNDKQVVVVEKEVIKILPANPEVIYVPAYDPQLIYVQQPATVVVQDGDDDEAMAALIGFGVGVLVGAAFAEDNCDWYLHDIYHGGYYGWVGAWRPVPTPYNPRGIYDPRGVYDPRGLYDPRGAADPRGAYDPRGVADPRGAYDPRGVADPRGAYDPRGVADPRGAYDPRGVADPRGAYDPRGAADPRGAYDPRGAADPRGVADTRGIADTRGVADPRGMADPRSAMNRRSPTVTPSRGYAGPAASGWQGGSFGHMGQNASLNRQSSRGGYSLGASGRMGGARAGGGGRGGRR
jgi:hypothetical protein